MPILSFSSVETEALFRSGRSRRFGSIATVALRKLDMLAATAVLEDLRSPPGNRLEALKGDRKGQHSIRVNDQFRICFTWTSSGPRDVGIVDYHRG